MAMRPRATGKKQESWSRWRREDMVEGVGLVVPSFMTHCGEEMEEGINNEGEK